MRTKLQSGSSQCHLVCERGTCYIAGGLIVVVFRKSETHLFHPRISFILVKVVERISSVVTRRATADLDGVSKVVLGGVWENLGDRWRPHNCWWLKTDLWPSGSGSPPGRKFICRLCCCGLAFSHSMHCLCC